MKPKSVLITGASSGIGAALALEYADKGIFLALSARNLDRLDLIANNCRKKGASVEIKILDVTKSKAMMEWISEIDERVCLDLVIANAGIAGDRFDYGQAINLTRMIFNTNIEGVLNTVIPALNCMEQRGSGQIAIMSSLASFRGFYGAPSYIATKAAVRIWGEGLRERYKEKGIKVSVICPGFVKSRITENNLFWMPLLMSGEKAAKIIRRGLHKNYPRIAFPRRMYFIALAYSLLPTFLANLLTPKIPQKE